jgi:hypothetical protein
MEWLICCLSAGIWHQRIGDNIKGYLHIEFQKPATVILCKEELFTLLDHSSSFSFKQKWFQATLLSNSQTNNDDPKYLGYS